MRHYFRITRFSSTLPSPSLSPSYPSRIGAFCSYLLFHLFLHKHFLVMYLLLLPSFCLHLTFNPSLLFSISPYCILSLNTPHSPFIILSLCHLPSAVASLLPSVTSFTSSPLSHLPYQPPLCPPFVFSITSI